MNHIEFLESRSTLYLETTDALSKGEDIPFLDSGVRPLTGKVSSWKDMVSKIRFLVKNRRDSNNANSFHTSPSMNKKQWGRNREYYTNKIARLGI